LARGATRATPTKSNSGGPGQLLGDVLGYLAALLEPATLIWEVGSGYFCCRNKDGSFSSEKFTTLAAIPHIKMVELKLSQGAKPGHGGVLPAAKVSPEIARIRDVPMGQDCISPAGHSAFSTPIEMLQFIAELRRLSGGKTTGFKLCVGQPWEFLAVIKAMLKTGITPDFIVTDGTEGGTGAAPLEFMDHMGMPLRDGLSFVNSELVGTNLRERIKLGASGKITTAFDMARVMALGADWCNAARGFIFAVGCIQSQQCHTDRCPTGVATQDRTRQRALVVSDKSVRVASFHRETVKALGELVAAAGLDHPRDLRSYHFVRRGSDRTSTFMELCRCLEPGELLSGKWIPDSIRVGKWRAPTASFPPLARRQTPKYLRQNNVKRGPPRRTHPYRRERQSVAKPPLSESSQMRV
jgi:glutamate synthase domain-containing protein 2